MFKTRFISMLVLLLMTATGVWAQDQYPIVYDFEAAANADENPANKNGSPANGQAFYAWENPGNPDSKRQDYKGYLWAEGSVLPEVCHVWRRTDRINGNVSGYGGLKCPNNREMAIDGLTPGLTVTIIYDATNADEGSKELVWAIGDGSSDASLGHVRATATINGVEAVPGTTTIASGDVITVNSVTPAENGTGYIVFAVNRDMIIKKVIIDVASNGYTVSMPQDTPDANLWTAKAGTDGEYQALPLEGVAAGTAVSVKYFGTKKVESVKAVKKASAVPVTAITLNKTATTISAGQTETLSVSSVTPDNATDQTVTWSSDNDAVATVDADGKVTAVALGTANITATANDGSGVKATCAVTVSKVVTISQSDWGWGASFTKDGVTVSAGGEIDPNYGNLIGGGTFSTTLGNFTKIVVTADNCYVSGTGWSGNDSSMTWAGTPASTVSFSGDFTGMGMTQTTIVCTIVPKN